MYHIFSSCQEVLSEFPNERVPLRASHGWTTTRLMASCSTARAPDGGLLFYYPAGNPRMAPRPATRGPGRLSRGWVSSALCFWEGGAVYFPPRSTPSRLLTAVTAEGLAGYLTRSPISPSSVLMRAWHQAGRRVQASARSAPSMPVLHLCSHPGLEGPTPLTPVCSATCQLGLLFFWRPW